MSSPTFMAYKKFAELRTLFPEQAIRKLIHGIPEHLALVYDEAYIIMLTEKSMCGPQT